MASLPRRLRRLRAYLSGSIGTQVQVAFGLTVLVALLVALVSLSAMRDATGRLESIQDSQRAIASAIRELELGTELQSNGVQAFLLSGDERYLENQRNGKARFERAFAALDELTLTDEGADRLEEIDRVYERFEASAASQLALYRQGWQRSATYLWRTEGQETKQAIERQIETYRVWFEAGILADVEAARERGRQAMLAALGMIVLAAMAGLAVGVRLTRSITVRLGKLAVAAQAIARDDFTARARVAGQDEVAALAAAMNLMAEHLEASQLALEESRQKLHDSLEQYRLLAENAMDVVYALDVTGRYVYVNAAIELITGYRPEEMLGHHFGEFVVDAQRARRLAAFSRRVQGEQDAGTAEVTILARDGREVPVEVRLANILREGQVVGVQGIARDITRRKALEMQIRRLAEQESRRAEQLQEVVRVGREIARLVSLDELLPDVVQKLHQVFGYERVEIFLVDPQTGVATLRASAGRFDAPMPPNVTVRDGQGIVGWVAAHGEALRVGDVRAEPRYERLPATEGTRSELTVPIRAAGEVLGVLDVESSQVDHFDASDEATLVILGDQIGTAIQNARLFEQQHTLAVAEERNRLAREIHDTLAQGLTGITLQLEVADALLEAGPELARPKIARALELARENLEEARRSVMDLRAAPLQEQTLPAALQELAGAFGQDHGLQASVTTRGVAGRLPSAIEAGLYRIAQEALNNVVKHAGARAVQLSLEQDDGLLTLTIQDDGAGFDPGHRVDRRKGGFGLVGMQERAKLLGGKLEVVSTPGGGTWIVVRVPAPTRRESGLAAAGAERT